jgi:curli production assembly/transport component CsgG
MSKLPATLLAVFVAAIGLTACATAPKKIDVAASTLAVYPAKTGQQKSLNEIPPPAAPIAVAVYGFTDQTGKFQASDAGQSLSRAVTQGGGSILVKALQDAGDRKWFTVVERESLKNLLNERQIITEMRARYLGELSLNTQALPALLFAGVILEGGIVSYDTNTLTGGNGAALLGLGINEKYKQDTVTVYLRAVSVKTGEILTTVTTSKTVNSRALQGNVFAYVASDMIAQSEVGYTTNEPTQLALQQAIEKAVYGMVMEGVDLKLWSFANPEAGWPMLWRYRQERDGVITAEQVERMNADLRGGRTPKSALTPPPAEKASSEARLQNQSPKAFKAASGDPPKQVRSGS